MPENRRSPLGDLRWHRISAEIAWSKPSSFLRGHPLSVFESAVKAVTSRLYGNSLPAPECVPFFHARGRGQSMKFSTGDRLILDFLLVRQDEGLAGEWRRLLEEYFSVPENARTIHVVALGPLERRGLEDLRSEVPISETRGEVCLEFLVPFPFSAEKERDRTYIGKRAFISSFEKRFSRLFGRPLSYASARDDFAILPYYWNYTEIRHDSHSQPGEVQLVKGCVGKFYIKGEYGDFLPFLLLGSELHGGGKLSNSQGYYLFHPRSLPFFDSFFPGQTGAVAATRAAIERYDQALAALSKSEHYPFDEKVFAKALASDIASGEYRPAPSTAFRIKKTGGRERIIEQLPFRDLIACQYLLTTVYSFFDRFFEPESIGFRKGISRQRAVEIINQAVAEGFSHVIESDIEDFFPSIDHGKLLQLLDFYLPSQDSKIRRLFQSLLANGFVLDGVLHERVHGLAQGNPLSPLLANLYLDSFDEEIKSFDSKLVRYADDFVILCRSRADAEALLAHSGSFLDTLGLKLSKDKTAIKPIEEGFQFLGIRFGSETAEPDPEEGKSLKKPLYITEPYLFLSLENDAVEVVQHGKLLESIPLRRVSEIMVMEKTVFSTALVRKCVEGNIPMSITLNNGYYVTTIKPDSKRFFAVSAEHARRYEQLSATEVLCVAKEFAAGKIAGYRTLFRQRYLRQQNLFIHELDGYIARIHEAGDIQQVRGLEGLCARLVYPKLNLLINEPLFHIKSRERKQPDPINSLLNFGYYLLFSRLNATVRSAGLNPYLGFLHSPNDDYESLVCDIEELFRARIDRFIIRLLNLKIITHEDFTEGERGFRLNRDAVKKFLAHFEAELDRKPKGQGLPLKDHFYVQVSVFKRWLLENRSLTFYNWLS